MNAFYRKLTITDWEQLLQISKEKTLIISILVNWSGASLILDTYLQDIAEKFQDQASFFFINHQQGAFLLAPNGLQPEMLPCIIVLKDGSFLVCLPGVQARRKLEAQIQQYL